MTQLVAVVGGIGVGKSVVCKILRTMGYLVFDCDSRAKIIMDSDPIIHRQLNESIHPEAVVDGCINRPLISQIVFNDSEALARLNNIVHSAVIADLYRWRGENSADYNKLFVETAIPVTSRIVEIVDQIWQVEAPKQLRIDRVMARSGLTVEQVEARVASQKKETIEKKSPYALKTSYIYNDNITPILPQIQKLLLNF